jgi:hypothetical protein
MRVRVARNFDMCLALQVLVCYLVVRNVPQMTPMHRAKSNHHLHAQTLLVNPSLRDTSRDTTSHHCDRQ